MRRGLHAFPAAGTQLLQWRFLTPPRSKLAPLDLSEAIERASVVVGNLRIRVGVWGEGPLVILVHGWAGSASQLEPARRWLVQHHYRVAAFDAPAHGGSPGRQSNALHFADAVERVVDQFGQPRALIGHSLGGMGAALARQRMASPAALVLLAPLPSLEFALDEFRAMLGFSAELRERLARRMERKTGLLREQLRLDAMGLDQVPTLLVHDAVDRSIGVAHSRDLASRSPSVEYRETSGLGHRRLLRDDAVLERMTQFLDSLPQAESPAARATGS